jgi:hypothetical protein
MFIIIPWTIVLIALLHTSRSLVRGMPYKEEMTGLQLSLLYVKFTTVAILFYAALALTFDLCQYLFGDQQ